MLARLCPRGARTCGLALGLLLAGCASLRPPDPEVARAARDLPSYSATLRVSLRGAGLRGRVRVLLAFARPDKLRVEVPGPGGLRLLAVARGGTLWAVFPGEAAWFSGPAEAEQMDALLGLALTPGEVMDVLVGHAAPRLRAYQARWEGVLPRQVRVTLADGRRVGLKIEQADAPVALADAAFDEPPHQGYRRLDVGEARALWGGR